MAVLIMLTVIARNLLRGNCRRNTFCISFWCLALGSNPGFKSNKAKHYPLGYGNFTLPPLTYKINAHDSCYILTNKVANCASSNWPYLTASFRVFRYFFNLLIEFHSESMEDIWNVWNRSPISAFLYFIFVLQINRNAFIRLWLYISVVCWVETNQSCYLPYVL